MWPLTLLGALLVAVPVAARPGNFVRRGGQEFFCKCYPGDACYPSPAVWSQLNRTVDGNLHVAAPPGAVCHDSLNGIPTFDAARCAETIAKFSDEQFTTDDPIANLWTFWTNDTCLPTTDRTAPCTRGFYGDWVVQAKTHAHVKSVVDFARTHGVRLVVRNTGHEFMGRSTGFGALILNMHSFTNIELIKHYKGPGSWRNAAVKLDAGVQGHSVYSFVNSQVPPLVVIGGECPTVGPAGGFMQGGGHGPLSSLFGMAADNALSIEALTVDGRFVTANEVENPDLFWALRGGGPSAFAVVLSVTVKAFPDVPSAGVVININSTHTNDTDLFYKGVAAVHGFANYFVDHHMMVYFELSPLRFHVQPIMGPNMTAAQITTAVQPVFDALNAAQVPFSTSTKEFPTFMQLYFDLFEPEAAGTSVLLGGRIMTHRDLDENAQGIVDAFRNINDNGGLVVGHIVGPGVAVPVGNNAVNPAWRQASSKVITSTPIGGNAPLEDKARAHNLVTNVMGEALRRAAPHGGAYVNEADIDEPHWQQAFFGSNYPRLFQLRKKWDPTGVLYARATPGTEEWEVIDDGTRLCKKI